MSRLQPESAKYKAFTGCYMATVENKAVMRGSVDSGCCGVNVLKTQGRGGALGYHLKTGHTLSLQNRPTGLA